MAEKFEQNISELERRLAKTEVRLRELENVDAVRNVLAEYCRAVDWQDLSALESLFTRDAQLAVKPWNVEVKGRDAVIEFFRQFFAAEEMTDDRHFCANQKIEKKGENYEAFCFFHAVAVWGTQSIIEWGTYTDTLAFEDGNWKFQKRHIDIHVLTSTEKGWAGPQKIIFGV